MAKGGCDDTSIPRACSDFFGDVRASQARIQEIAEQSLANTEKLFNTTSQAREDIAAVKARLDAVEGRPRRSIGRHLLELPLLLKIVLLLLIVLAAWAGVDMHKVYAAIK